MSAMISKVSLVATSRLGVVPCAIKHCISLIQVVESPRETASPALLYFWDNTILLVSSTSILVSPLYNGEVEFTRVRLRSGDDHAVDYLPRL